MQDVEWVDTSDDNGGECATPKIKKETVTATPGPAKGKKVSQPLPTPDNVSPMVRLTRSQAAGMKTPKVPHPTSRSGLSQPVSGRRRASTRNQNGRQGRTSLTSNKCRGTTRVSTLVAEADGNPPPSTIKKRQKTCRPERKSSVEMQDDKVEEMAAPNVSPGVAL